jgi:hypothetical protein
MSLLDSSEQILLSSPLLCKTKSLVPEGDTMAFPRGFFVARRSSSLSSGMEFNRQTVAKLQPEHLEKADQWGFDTCHTAELEARHVALLAFSGFPLRHFLACAPSQRVKTS